MRLIVPDSSEDARRPAATHCCLNKKAPPKRGFIAIFRPWEGPKTRSAYIMSIPPMPPPGMPPPFSSLGSSATIASVVMISPAMEAAFCRA